jgi:plastocyanin
MSATQRIGLLHAGLAQHVDECDSQFLGHRCGSPSSLICTTAMRTVRLTRAATATITFDKAGTYRYFCQPHPWMVAELTVS